MMVETFAVIGYGSIGKRHVENLARVRPLARVVKVDPVRHDGVMYGGLDDLLESTTFLSGALICSPHEAHLEALVRLSERRIPLYLEKPVCSLEQYALPGTRSMLVNLSDRAARSGMGFQYRYHTLADQLYPRRAGLRRLDFEAQDDLFGRYGPTVLETMASHSIDLALWLLGPVVDVDLRSNGTAAHGTVVHAWNFESHYQIDMTRGPRCSTVTAHFSDGQVQRFTIDADQWMYQRCLMDWLNYARDGVRTMRLATLREGLAVQDVMRAASLKH